MSIVERCPVCGALRANNTYASCCSCGENLNPLIPDPLASKDFQELLTCAIGMYKDLMSDFSIRSLFDDIDDQSTVKMRYITKVLKRLTGKDVKDILKLEIIFPNEHSYQCSYCKKITTQFTDCALSIPCSECGKEARLI